MSEPRFAHPDELLSAYIDDAIDERERARVEDHIAGCARCRTVVADLAVIVRSERDEELPEVPDGLAERVRAAVDARAARPVLAEAPGLEEQPAAHRATRRAARPWWRSPFAMAAAATVVVASLVGVLVQRTPRFDIAETARPSVSARPAPVAGAEAPAEAERGLQHLGYVKSEAPAQAAKPNATPPAAATKKMTTAKPKRAEDSAAAAPEDRMDGVGVVGGQEPTFAPAPQAAGGDARDREKPRPQPGSAKAVPPGTSVEGQPGLADKRAQALPAPPPPPPPEAGVTMARAPSAPPAGSIASAPPRATWRTADPDAAWRDLGRFVTGLGGRVGAPVGGDARGVWVPSDRADALLAGLRERGLTDLPRPADLRADEAGGVQLIVVVVP